MSARILVVEDRPSVGAILTCAFEQEGCTAFLARSGAQALDYARRLEPDLIVLDLRVSSEAIDALCAESITRAIPIIAISAHAHDVRPGAPSEAARIFGEPFYPAEVVAAAMDALQSPARLGR